MFARLHSYIGPIIVIGGTGFIIGTSVLLSEYGFPRVPTRTWPAFVYKPKPSLDIPDIP